MERVEKWYQYNPDGVIENKGYKILWDMSTLCDKVIESKRPNIVLISYMYPK